jgi:hypothetical protein
MKNSKMKNMNLEFDDFKRRANFVAGWIYVISAALFLILQ